MLKYKTYNVKVYDLGNFKNVYKDFIRLDARVA